MPGFSRLTGERMKDTAIACECHLALVILPADAARTSCVWPACLTEEQADRLLKDVERELRGAP